MITYNSCTYYLDPKDNGWTKDKYQRAFEQLREDALLLTALIDIQKERTRWKNNRLIRNETLMRILDDFVKANPGEGLITEWDPMLDALVCIYDSRKKKRYDSNIEVLSNKLMFGLAGFVFNQAESSITARGLPRALCAEVRKKGVATQKRL